MTSPTPDQPVRVFVHLAHGFGASRWRAKWDRGEIVGLNDRLPYGYFRAEEYGCSVEYSEDGRDGVHGQPAVLHGPCKTEPAPYIDSIIARAAA